ncbi:MAG: hypothetical protein Tsb002_16160 [Wenzhouxiangellaceae bacterium]
MKYIYLTCSLVVLALLSGQAQADSLLYEKVFNQFAELDNRMTLSVSESGEVHLHRPSFMTYPGDHHWQLDATAVAELWAALQPATLRELDSGLMTQALQQLRADTEIYVSDSDTTRLQLASGRGDTHELVVDGLQGWALTFPQQSSLQILAATESRLVDWVNFYLTREQRS